MSDDTDTPIDLVPVDACPICGLPATAELVAALGELQEPTKGGSANIKSERGQYSYRYLELPDLLAAVRGPLAAHHLAVIQEVTNGERDVTVRTIIMHASGRRFWSPSLTLRSGGSAQDIGSASTYGRRYSLSAMVGLAGSEDDDGQQATRQPPAEQPARPPADDRPARVDHRGGNLMPGTASEQSVKLMWKLLRDTGMDAAQIRGWAAAVLQIGDDWSTKDLSQAQVSSLIDRLKAEAEADEGGES